MLGFRLTPYIAVPCMPFFYVRVPGNVFTGTVDGKLWKIGAGDSLTFITQMGQSLPECGWCLFIRRVFFCSSSFACFDKVRVRHQAAAQIMSPCAGVPTAFAWTATVSS